MKLVVKVWATRDGYAFLRTADGEVSILLDEATLEAIAPVGVDIEEGDELALDVSVIRRTRPSAGKMRHPLDAFVEDYEC